MGAALHRRPGDHTGQENDMADYEPNSSDFEPRGFRVLAAVVLGWSVILGIAALFTQFPWNIFSAVSAIIAGLIGYAVLRIILAIEASTHRLVDGLVRVNKSVEQATLVLQTIGENILLSEEAKSIAFREKDRDALRAAIDYEFNREDWEAALYLADQMEKRFGYRQEAEQLRERIARGRTQQRHLELATVMESVDQLIAAHNWDEAAGLIETIKSQFAGEFEVESLSEKLDQARNEHKKHLLKQWDEAVQQNDIDQGIEILKELDKFLSPTEVAALEESARGVFRAKLHNLGVQFSLLVAEKHWDKALEVGEEIVNEFPNSQMAQEIRERLDTLKAKARMQQGPRQQPGELDQ
jgi:hypothetical protein